MVSPQSDDEQFDFYLKFAKPLVLNLSDTSDRIKAAAWIRKLKDDTHDAALRTDYLKLLLFVLQRRKLIGPFATVPDNAQPLQPFPQEINLQDVAKNFVEIDKNLLKEAIANGGFGEWPPYNVACSSDLKEYAASQDIPNFGVHVYFAISKDPIQNWQQKNKAIFPIGEKIEASNDFGLSTNISPNISSFVSQEQPSPTSDRSAKKSEGGDGAAGVQDRNMPVPSPPNPFDVDSSITPTWGSNLMKVNDDVLEEDFKEEDFNFNVSDRDMLDLDDEDIDLDAIEGISDLEDSFYLDGDKLKSPERVPCSSPAPSLPYKSPPVPTVNLPSPAPSLPYRTPPRTRSPDEMFFDRSVDNEENEDMYFDDDQPCQPCGSTSTEKQTRIQGYTQSSPAPSLPYRTPPVPTSDRPSPGPSLPYKTTPQLETSFDLKCSCADDADMLDYMDESMDLVDDISYGDAATYLQMDSLMTPPKHQPCGSSSTPLARSPQSQSPSQMHEQVCQPCQSSGTAEGEIHDTTANQSGEGLGGDSFIAPESKNFRWLQDAPPGPGLPEDMEQNPDLWESFGWWTDNPDEIFDYIPPSPRVCGSPDPYAEERERWADVPPTPPIFSRDPQIQTGPGAQRIYAIEEFGMESFEEPVWTSAEQYMRYMPESPYQDPRDINRQTLDVAQYTNVCAQLDSQLFEAQGETDENYFFAEEQPPIDDLEVSFNAEEYQKMNKAQAAFEAIQHGPARIGAPPTPPPPPLEDQIPHEDAMADVDFLSKAPPKFVFEPNFFSTPPKYDPNPRLNAADFDESITKYIEDEMKMIQSDIPVTTPDRSPSPKRKKRFIGNETLPNIEDINIDNEMIVCSPELKTPPKYHATSKKEIQWDTEIGEPRQLSPLKPAYLGTSENERQAMNAARKQELSAIYQQQFASPPLVRSPERPPHLIDEPIPDDLGSPLPPKKLPPPGWNWQSPPSSQQYSCDGSAIKTPTGLTPPKKMPEDITMFYESPPHEIYSPPPSPSSAVGALQISPPARFDSPPSPVCSPGGRPVFADWQPALVDDEIGMEQVYPAEYEDLMTEEYPDLYTSPTRAAPPEYLNEFDMRTANLSPASKKKYYDTEIEALENEIFQGPSTPCQTRSPVQSPGSPITPEYERRIWKENLRLHDLNDYWRRQWVVRPKPGKAKAVKRFTVGSRLGTIPDQEEPCSPPRLPETAPLVDTVHTNIEAKLDDLRRAEEEAIRIARQNEADRQVKRDIEDLTKITYRTPPRPPLYASEGVDQNYIDSINRTVREVDALCRRQNLEESVRNQIQSQFTSPPRPCAPPVVHPFDEPLPEENDLPSALLPPSGWTWQTPPKYKFPENRPCEKRTPTGLESPEKMSEDVSMFYESPPRELLSPPSPSAATAALQYTPTCGFDVPTSPIRSPGGRPITESWKLDDIIDDIDMDKVYPEQFEDIYDEEIPDLYMSPPKVCGTENIRQEINVTFPKSPCQQSTSAPRATTRPLSPVTPERERQMWKENLRLHELHGYGKKQWTVRPKPGKTRKVKRFTPRPGLHTISDEREQMSPEVQQPIQSDEIATTSAELNAEVAAAIQGLEATEEVLRDMMDLPEVLTFPPTGKTRVILYSDPTTDFSYVLQQMMEADDLQYEMAKAVIKSEIDRRVRDQFNSPPRAASPEPTVHPFDEPLSEELSLPTALLPPSGWSWKTPEKYKLPDYKPTAKYSPKEDSPDRPFSEDVTMFYESPPHGFLSPTAPTNVRPVEHSSSLAQSPIRMDVEDDIYLDNMLDAECIDYIEGEENPELYISPTKDTSPIQIQHEQAIPTVEDPTMSLDDQIAALEFKCFGERIITPTRQQRMDELSCRGAASQVPDIQRSPETPEYKRRQWKENIKLHAFDREVMYPKQQWVVQPKASKKVRVPRHARKPKLNTICDAEEPSTSKVNRQDIINAEKKMQESRRIYEVAQKQAMQDILKLQELTQASIANKSPCYQGFSEEENAKLKGDIARRVREQFRSPPQNIQQPDPIMTHPFDEELPHDLPSALLPPSNWGWKTPPGLKHQQFVEPRIISPTGISPPTRFDPESLLYESPPQLSPEEDLAEICVPCTSDGTTTRAPLKSPKERPTQLQGVSPVHTHKRSPKPMPQFAPIETHLADSDPFESDENQMYPPCIQDIDEEYPPEELSGLPSPTSSNVPEPMSDAEYRQIIDAEMRAVDNITREMPQQHFSPCSPPTPVYSRRIWQQELASRVPLQLPQKSWVVKPKPGKSYRVRDSKKPDLSPVKEKYLEWSPEVVCQSPITSTSPIPSPRTTPGRQNQMPPENWTWKTPSPQTLKATHGKLVEENNYPLLTPTGNVQSPEIFYESPPDIPQTPPDTSPINVCSPCTASPPQVTPEFYYPSPESQSPVISPDISPYRSPLRSPGGRPVAPEWAQQYDEDFYFSEILPNQQDYVDEEAPPEEIYEAALPPTPPPLPATPTPYLHQIKLTPRTRPRPDINMFSPERSPTRTADTVYQSPMSPCRPPETQSMRRGETPESAKRPYEPFAELVRFEPKRPTPKPSPVPEYQTPARAQFRGPRRRRQINRDAPRRRLIFEDEADIHSGFENIENLQQAMETSVPCGGLRDVDAESPPRDADISVLTEFDFEPPEFNLFEEDNQEEYNVRLPFQGQAYRSSDGSPIPVIDEIPEEEKDFRWLSCSSNCQNTPKR